VFERLSVLAELCWTGVSLAKHLKCPAAEKFWRVTSQSKYSTYLLLLLNFLEFCQDFFNWWNSSVRSVISDHVHKVRDAELIRLSLYVCWQREKTMQPFVRLWCDVDYQLTETTAVGRLTRGCVKAAFNQQYAKSRRDTSFPECQWSEQRRSNRLLMWTRLAHTKVAAVERSHLHHTIPW
jgi:hypothetical protein